MSVLARHRFVQGLRRRAGRIEVNFSLDAGEILALIGP